MIDRKKFLAELALRKQMRKFLEKKEKTKDSILERKKKEYEFRQAIRKTLLQEKKGNPNPHKNTGINVLSGVLKKIIPILREDFKSLTTEPSQRRSFRAHIINGAKNSLAPIRAIASADIGSVAGDYDGKIEDDDLIMPGGLDEAPEDEQGGEDPDNVINISTAQGDSQEKNQDAEEKAPEDDLPDPQDKVIDIDGTFEDPEEEEEEEVDNFSVDGEDSTGRNMAIESFNKIEKTIIDGYSLLDNKRDQEMFYEYMITNLKLYFDRWEDEIRTNLDPEDATPEETPAQKAKKAQPSMQKAAE